MKYLADVATSQNVACERIRKIKQDCDWWSKSCFPVFFTEVSFSSLLLPFEFTQIK